MHNLTYEFSVSLTNHIHGYCYLDIAEQLTSHHVILDDCTSLQELSRWMRDNRFSPVFGRFCNFLGRLRPNMYKRHILKCVQGKQRKQTECAETVFSLMAILGYTG